MLGLGFKSDRGVMTNPPRGPQTEAPAGRGPLNYACLMGAPPRIATLACGALAAALMACAEEAPPREPRNGLLITLDTTRVDALGSYGAPPSVSPALDQLAREGVYFEDCYVSSSITLPSHAALLTSTNPRDTGVTDKSSWYVTPRGEAWRDATRPTTATSSR